MSNGIAAIVVVACFGTVRLAGRGLPKLQAAELTKAPAEWFLWLKIPDPPTGVPGKQGYNDEVLESTL